eukprot:gene16148-biopygen11276
MSRENVAEYRLPNGMAHCANHWQALRFRRPEFVTNGHGLIWYRHQSRVCMGAGPGRHRPHASTLRGTVVRKAVPAPLHLHLATVLLGQVLPVLPRPHQDVHRRHDDHAPCVSFPPDIPSYFPSARFAH